MTDEVAAEERQLVAFYYCLSSIIFHVMFLLSVVVPVFVIIYQILTA